MSSAYLTDDAPHLLSNFSAYWAKSQLLWMLSFKRMCIFVSPASSSKEQRIPKHRFFASSIHDSLVLLINAPYASVDAMLSISSKFVLVASLVNAAPRYTIFVWTLFAMVFKHLMGARFEGRRRTIGVQDDQRCYVDGSVRLIVHVVTVGDIQLFECILVVITDKEDIIGKGLKHFDVNAKPRVAEPERTIFRTKLLARLSECQWASQGLRVDIIHVTEQRWIRVEARV